MTDCCSLYLICTCLHDCRYLHHTLQEVRESLLLIEHDRRLTFNISIMRLSPSSAQLKPSLYYQIFIPADIVCLVIQAAGGGLSTQSDGSSKVGVNLGLAGLSLQVIFIALFIVLSVQYGIRYRRDVKAGKVSGDALDRRFKQFVVFLSLALLVIFIRCCFRIYELSEGYAGSAFHNEGVFIGLESV